MRSKLVRSGILGMRQGVSSDLGESVGGVDESGDMFDAFCSGQEIRDRVGVATEVSSEV